MPHLRTPLLALCLCLALLLVLAPLPALAVDGLITCTPPTQRVDCQLYACNASNRVCVPCTSDDECWEAAMYCDTTDGGHCYVANLFSSKFNAKYFFVIVFALLTCLCGLVAGVGGGGVLVPIYAGMAGLPIQQAVFVSLATVVGQGIVNCPAVLMQFDPEYSSPGGPVRPLADMQTMAIWYPIAGAGTIVGQICGRFVPSWFRMACLFVLAIFATYRVTLKAQAQRKAEQQDERGEEMLEPGQPTRPQLEEQLRRHPVAGAEHFGDVTMIMPNTARNLASQMDEAEQEIRLGRHDVRVDATVQDDGRPTTDVVEDDSYRVMDRGAAEGDQMPAGTPGLSDQQLSDEPAGVNHPQSISRFQPVEWGILVFTIVIGVAIALFVLHGEGVECGGAAFWLLSLLGVAIMFATSLVYRHRVSKVAAQVEGGYAHPINLSVSWNLKNSIVLPSISITAGLGSSLLGLGGGLILSPLMLESGLKPERVSATGNIITALIALQSMLIAMGGSAKPRIDYVLTFAAVGAISTGLGRFYLLREIRKRKMTWVIVACLAVILVATLVSTLALGIVNLVELTQYDAGVGFGKLCSVHKELNLTAIAAAAKLDFDF